MKTYEDPQEHFDRFIRRAADRYVDGLQKAGLPPSETLIGATLAHNISMIQDLHRARNKQIDREGAKMALVICPLAIAMFGVVGWLQPEPIARLLYWSGALAFLVMLVVALWRARA